MAAEAQVDAEPTAIEVSRQAPEDVEGVMRVYYETWMATYPNDAAGVTRDDIEARFATAFSHEELQKRRARIENSKSNELSLVAKADGTVVGVCRVVKEDGINRLKSMYVLPAYQGRGIGSRMWDEARAFLDERNDTIVEAVDYNRAAIDFYRSKGFVETGNRRQDERHRMKSGAIFTEIEMRRPADNPQ